MHIAHQPKTGPPFHLSRDMYLYNTYLELACHDKQNGGQNINLQTRIAELWQFEA